MVAFVKTTQSKQEILYIGESTARIPWHSVISVSADGHELTRIEQILGRPILFRSFIFIGDAAKMIVANWNMK